MRRSPLLYALLVTVFLSALIIAPPRSRAITYGFVDSANAFSNTGAFVVRSNATGEIFPFCSGSLITPNVFLTAAHCISFFENELEPAGFTAFVSFDGSMGFGDLTSNQTTLLDISDLVINPRFTHRQNDPGDIGVVILESNVVGATPATLPECGLLNDLARRNGLKSAVFTNVGYGVQNRVVGGGVPFFQDLNPIPRMFSFSSFNALNKGYLRLSQNPATGNGGACFGDSGGPVFMTVDNEEIEVAIVITGDVVCQSTNVVYRLDTSSTQNFFAFVNEEFGTQIPIECSVQATPSVRPIDSSRESKSKGLPNISLHPAARASFSTSRVR